MRFICQGRLPEYYGFSVSCRIPAVLLAAVMLSSCAAMHDGQPAEKQQVEAIDATVASDAETVVVEEAPAAEAPLPVATPEGVASENSLAFLQEEDREYHLGVGDRISITVWDYPKLSRQVQIKETGSIFAPYAGMIELEGKTIEQARQILIRRYSSYVKNPQIDVEVYEYASKKLYIIGDLDVFGASRQVGAQTFKADSGHATSNALQVFPGLSGLTGGFGAGAGASTPSSDVAIIGKNKKVGGDGQLSRVIPIRGKVTLFEAMLETNILSSDVNWASSYMLRNNEILPVDFKRLMETGDRRTDLMLQNRDILYLPSTKDQKVFVLGEVGKQAIVPLYKNRLSLVDALAQAGYVKITARKDSVKVIRGGLVHPEVISINLEALEDGDARQNVALQAGDIVFVPESFIGSVNEVITLVSPSLNMLMQTIAIYSITKSLN
jgi:protein involved in polysaccharide export with SLBB domain